MVTATSAARSRNRYVIHDQRGTAAAGIKYRQIPEHFSGLCVQTKHAVTGVGIDHLSHAVFALKNGRHSITGSCRFQRRFPHGFARAAVHGDHATVPRSIARLQLFSLL